MQKLHSSWQESVLIVARFRQNVTFWKL